MDFDVEPFGRVVRFRPQPGDRVGAGTVRRQGEADPFHARSPAPFPPSRGKGEPSHEASPSSFAPSSLRVAGPYLSDSCFVASPSSVAFQSGVLSVRQESIRERRSASWDSSAGIIETY